MDEGRHSRRVVMGRFLPVMPTTRLGQVERKWVGKSVQLLNKVQIAVKRHRKGQATALISLTAQSTQAAPALASSRVFPSLRPKCFPTRNIGHFSP